MDMKESVTQWNASGSNKGVENERHIIANYFYTRIKQYFNGSAKGGYNWWKKVLLNDDGTWSFEEKVLPNNSASKPVFRKSSWDYSYEKVTGTEEIKILHK